MAILNLSLTQETSVEAVNAALEAASVAPDTQKQIGFRWSTELVRLTSWAAATPA